MLIAHALERFDNDEPGFAHAVALAAAFSGDQQIVSLHVRQGSGDGPASPQLATLLSRWNRSGAHIAHRVHECPGHDDISDELIAACDELRPDLLIMPTHARKGWTRWLAGSIAEAVARNLRAPMLLLPLGGSGLVDPQTGAVDVARALLLGGSKADAQLGVDATAWLARSAGQRCELTLLHVDDGTPVPSPLAAAPLQLRFEKRAGNFEQAAIDAAEALQPAFVAMVSHGHDEARDVLFGSHTERVLHVTRRPLLWVPPGWSPASV